MFNGRQYMCFMLLPSNEKKIEEKRKEKIPSMRLNKIKYFHSKLTINKELAKEMTNKR